ncbi:MAG: hypothetical protein ACPGQS_05455 [Bradymonadia bacterium]
MTETTPQESFNQTPSTGENTGRPDNPQPKDAESKAPSVKSFLGWTFFDPCNLLCITALSISTILAFNESQLVGLDRTWAVLIYYGCLAAFLRSYFYFYYYGGKLARIVVFSLLMLTLTVGGLSWNDAAKGFAYLSDGLLLEKGESAGFFWASLLHAMAGVSLTVHIIVPRRWLIRITEDIENRVPDEFGTSIITGQDTAD